MDKTLLTTGEVAQLLGVSRQHVVDLCDSLALEHTVAGDGRKRLIPLDVLLGYVLSDITGGEDYHALVAHAKLVTDLLSEQRSVLIERALESLDGDAFTGTDTQRKIWRTLLRRDVNELIVTILGTSTYCRGLRSCSPFEID